MKVMEFMNPRPDHEVLTINFNTFNATMTSSDELNRLKIETTIFNDTSIFHVTNYLYFVALLYISTFPIKS